jgi:hypothetical protein
MMTVRFPSGFSIQYNRATYVNRMASFTDLYTAKGGSWIAQIPNDAVIEVEPACRVYNPTTPDPNRLQAETALLSKEIRSLKRKLGVKK